MVKKRNALFPAIGRVAPVLVWPLHETVPETAKITGLWQEIWIYFQQPGTPKRTFHADFEAYEGEENVAIYIGIKEEV